MELWLPVGNAGLLGTAGFVVRFARADGDLMVTVAPDDEVAECDATDNTLASGGWPCP